MNDTVPHDSIAKTLALTRLAGVEPRLLQHLVARFGDLDSILSLNRATIEGIDGLTADQAEAIGSCRERLGEAEDFRRVLAERDIEITTRFMKNYPVTLFELNDPPPLLYVRGRLPQPDQKSITITGTRDATQQGIQLTVRLTRMFVEDGVQVVSSLARGIGAAVHLGARSAGGHSFAVLDRGLDHLEVGEDIPVAIDVAREGGVISEYPPDTEFAGHQTAASNRLLVGLTKAVVLTEVYHDSRHTQDLLSFCRDIGKMVFLMVDPEHGALSDEAALEKASEYGIIPMVGFEQVETMINALV